LLDNISPGMSLRDWFAGMDMQGLCANHNGPYSESDPIVLGPDNCSTLDVAREAFDLSNAMLAARKGVES
jgi:hypothetical protein